MHVVVCIKQVPNTTEVRINPETNTLIRDGVESIINPFDENALETALQLKDTHGAKVSVMTMGPPQAEAALREAMSRGADDCWLISDRAFAGSDTWATSCVLTAALRTLSPPPDLILFGKQAIDGDTAQVGPGVAELLDIPVIPYARKVEVVGDVVKVERAVEDGCEKLEARMPLALTILKEANAPRMASLKGRMRAKKAVIPVLNLEKIKANPDDIGLKGSPTRVVRIFSPPAKTGGIKIQGDNAQEVARAVVAKLKERQIL